MSISTLSQENRKFLPTPEFIKSATQKKSEILALYKKANKNPLQYWAREAQNLHWFKPWKTILQWKTPQAQWFKEGELNASYNCLDRHLDSATRNKAAIIWESESGFTRTLTYQELHRETCRLANALHGLGLKKNQVVVIYMGMVPEAVIAMLACSRLGLTHNVVFEGFSAEALRERILDSQAIAVLTQDYSSRRGEAFPLKSKVDEALSQSSQVKHVIVYHRELGAQKPCHMQSHRDHDWATLVNSQSQICKAEKLKSEHPLFILYTSGSTGKPKGLLHSTGGYLTQVHSSFRLVFDIQAQDIFFCSADVGWITGHSYICYGPLSHGATILLYEGTPNYPTPSRFWEMIEKHRVSIFYTAPTAIRSFMRWGEEHISKHDLSSLRLLGSVGEPINPEAWTWYYKIIGKNRCPIVDTWWQTETGAIMIAPIPAIRVTQPGSATVPLPGIEMDVVRKDAESCKNDEGGFLVVKKPWPSMARTIVGDTERYKKTYWSEFKDTKKGKTFYFTGDGARRDKNGYFWIMGRVDDVVNVSGHRLGTAEVESALVAHPAVAEAAVVARPDELTGQALVAFVSLKNKSASLDKNSLQKELKIWVAKEIGAIAKPSEIKFTETLPKTRSGKIMRRLLRDIVLGKVTLSDTSTLEDIDALEKLRASNEE